MGFFVYFGVLGVVSCGVFFILEFRDLDFLDFVYFGGLVRDFIIKLGLLGWFMLSYGVIVGIVLGFLLGLVLLVVFFFLYLLFVLFLWKDF